MKDIVEKLHSMPSLYSLESSSKNEVDLAEDKLGLRFADEYRKYVTAFGVASVFGHEFTGVCKFPRLNVVDVTQSERLANPSVPMNWYVVEQANIDGIVIWQSGNGDIYQTMPGAEPIRLCESLCAYLEM